MTRRVLQMAALALGAVLVLAASPAQADLIGFTALTDNSTVDPAYGEAQMFFEVGGVTPTITFHFLNLGPQDSSIEQIWFDDSNIVSDDGVVGLFSLSSVEDFITDYGVIFVGTEGSANFPASPKDWTTSFYYSAVSPAPDWGINPVEEIVFTLTLNPGYTYETVMAALGTGDLRVGIHVIAWADGKSESFINTPPPPGGEVPEPMTVGLLGLGLTAFVGFRWAGQRNRTH